MLYQPNDLISALNNLPLEVIESIWLGALLTERLCDEPHVIDARHIIAALESIRAKTVDRESLHLDVDTVATNSKSVTLTFDLIALRQALINEFKLRIMYIDGKGQSTMRIVWPIDVEDYGPNGAVLAFCEKRQDFRHFRFDRIKSLTIVKQRFGTPRNVLIAFFRALELEK